MNNKESAPKPKPTQEPDPSRFAKYDVLEDESGFKLEGTNHIFLFDSEGGWFDEYGNYYNADAVPCTPPDLSLEEEEITQNLPKKEEEKAPEHEGEEEDWSEDEEEEEEEEQIDDIQKRAYELYKKMAGQLGEEEEHEEAKTDVQSTTTATSKQENRFEEFWPTSDKSGFHINETEHLFLFDRQDGWFDEKGNYFNADGAPQPAPEYKDKYLEKFLKDKASLEKFFVRNIRLKSSKKELITYLERNKLDVAYDTHWFNDEKGQSTGSALVAVKEADAAKLLGLNGKKFEGAPLVIVKYA